MHAEYHYSHCDMIMMMMYQPNCSSQAPAWASMDLNCHRDSVTVGAIIDSDSHVNTTEEEMVKDSRKSFHPTRSLLHHRESAARAFYKPLLRQLQLKLHTAQAATANLNSESKSLAQT